MSSAVTKGWALSSNTIIGARRDGGRSFGTLRADRGIVVSDESIRLGWNKYGPQYARRLRRRHQGFGDIFYIDEVFVKIRGIQHYLWRAVDQDGEIVDVFLPHRRDGTAAKKFFKRLFNAHRQEPKTIVTDKLKSYGVAHRELIPDSIHNTAQYSNNRAELSHQPTRIKGADNAPLDIDPTGSAPRKRSFRRA